MVLLRLAGCIECGVKLDTLPENPGADLIQASRNSRVKLLGLSEQEIWLSIYGLWHTLRVEEAASSIPHVSIHNSRAHNQIIYRKRG
jgi:hypothetical protein